MSGIYDHEKATAFKAKDLKLLERMFNKVGELSTTGSNSEVLSELAWQHVIIRNHREKGE